MVNRLFFRICQRKRGYRMKNHATPPKNHATNHAINHGSNPHGYSKPRQPRQHPLVYVRENAPPIHTHNTLARIYVSCVVAVVGVVFINNQILKKILGVVCGVVFCFLAWFLIF